MSIMKLLQQAQGGQGLGQLAQQFGLDEAKAQELTQMLAPAIGSAAKQRAEQGGAEGLLESFRGEGQAQGMDFLQNLLGGQAEAEGLASEAASRSGIDASTVSQFLPALAAMVQGGMQKSMPDTSIDAMKSGLMGSAEGGSGGLMGMVGSLMGGAKGGDGGGLGPLMQMLDEDGDGSPLDDILGKFMKR